jgi:hypothetical protein
MHSKLFIDMFVLALTGGGKDLAPHHRIFVPRDRTA